MLTFSGQTQGRWRWSGVSERHVPRKHDVTNWERQTEAENQIHAWDNRDAHQEELGSTGRESCVRSL